MTLQYKVKTDKTVNDAVDILKDNLSGVGFGVLWELNFKDKLAEKGLDFEHDFIIMEVCNPYKAKEVLEKNIDVGFFLPCKIVVYEKKNEVYMGLLRPVEIVKRIDPTLVETAQTIEHILVEAIDKSI